MAIGSVRVVPAPDDPHPGSVVESNLVSSLIALAVIQSRDTTAL